MGFLNELLQEVGKLLNERKYKLFMALYERGEVTLNDHYRYLNQLLTIHAVIEAKFKQSAVTYVYPSERIANTLDRIKPNIVESVRQESLLNTTNNYVTYLKKINIDDKESNDILFAHFIVRFLCDPLLGSDKERALNDDESIGGSASTVIPELDASLQHRLNDWLSIHQFDEMPLDEAKRRKSVMIAAVKNTLDIQDKMINELHGNLTLNRHSLNRHSLFAIGASALVTAVCAVGLTLYMLDETTLTKLGNH